MEPQDDLIATAKREVDAAGWSLQYVSSGFSPVPYAYTAGLTQFAVPELIVFDIAEPLEAFDFLSRVRERALAPLTGPNSSYPLVHGTVMCDLFQGGFPVAAIRVKDSTQHLTAANALFGKVSPVEAVQLVLPDDSMRWPWDPESDLHHDVPLLGEPPAHLMLRR